jgi:hypothetical protein
MTGILNAAAVGFFLGFSLNFIHTQYVYGKMMDQYQMRPWMGKPRIKYGNALWSAVSTGLLLSIVGALVGVGIHFS